MTTSPDTQQRGDLHRVPAVVHGDDPAAHTPTAVLYLRVSTARQASKGGTDEGYSIPAQRQACTRKASELGAVVVDEFLDAGESARSADRPALQDMLDRLARGGVDYVIVHKVDRLARNRADDVAIGLAIHQSGATLVSVSEAVDDTPAGALLHGIMSSIAEFYSRNLSNEAKKGLHEKARRGDTPTYAPLGYLNVTERVDGREHRTVTVDEDRAPHITWAFESYATGAWSITELANELDRRGMKSRPTAKRAAVALSRSMVHRMLANPYYTGRLRYGGFDYDGNHQPIVDTDTFIIVQAVLANRRHAGDRSWVHQQYLKGSVYCGRCGERLGYAHSTGNGGTYPYFFCLGRHRKRNDCDLPYLPAEATEAAVTAQWARVRFTPTLRDLVRDVVDTEFDAMQLGDARLLETQQRRVRDLERRKKKLLDAYEADAVPLEDLKPRQAAITAELAEARRLIASASKHHDQIRQRITLALELLTRADELYQRCADEQRQTLNQVMFQRLELDIGDDGIPYVSDVALNPEFAALIELAEAHAPTELGSVVDHEIQTRTRNCRKVRNARTPAIVDRGSNLTHLAETVGFEPTVSFPTHAFQACRFGRSRTSPGGDDSLPVSSRRQVAAGSCAIGAREPGQGRKAAALSGTSGVPQIAWPPPDDVSSHRAREPVGAAN